MAVEFGKGIRGFLGRIPTVDYQYTPTPFREMLAMGQLAGQKEATNMKLMGEVNKLYNQPMLPKDQAVFDAKADNYNRQIGELINQSGGSLSNRNISNTLTQSYYDIVNDRDYANAINSYKEHEKLQLKIQNNVNDPDLRTSYINQSYANYENSPVGAPYNTLMEFSTMSELDFDKTLDGIATDLKATKIQKLQQENGMQATVKTVELDPQDIYDTLVANFEANNNLIRYAADKTTALGVDPQEWLKTKFENTANKFRQNDLAISKTTEIAGFENSIPKMDLEGAIVPSRIEDALGNYEDAGNTLLTLPLSKGYKDAASIRSIYNIVAEQAGISEEELNSLQEGETVTIRDEMVRLQNLIQETEDGFVLNAEIDPRFLNPSSGRQNFSINIEAETLEEAQKSVQNAMLDQEKLQRSKDAGVSNPFAIGASVKSYLDPQLRAEIPQEELVSTRLNAAVQDYIENTAGTRGVNYSDYAGKGGKVGDVMEGIGINLIGQQKDLFIPTEETMNLTGFAPTAISNRMYYDYNTQQPILYVTGQNEDKEEITGTIPARALMGANRELETINKAQKAFYDTQTAMDLSRLQYPGQVVLAEPLKGKKGLINFDTFAKEFTEKEFEGEITSDNFTVGVQFINGKYFTRMYDVKTEKPVGPPFGNTEGFASMNDVARYMDNYLLDLNKKK
jgi:hypothetical protein